MTGQELMFPAALDLLMSSPKSWGPDRKSTRLNQSRAYLVCRLLLEKKKPNLKALDKTIEITLVSMMTTPLLNF